jgi:hypothetical protein
MRIINLKLAKLSNMLFKTYLGPIQIIFDYIDLYDTYKNHSFSVCNVFDDIFWERCNYNTKIGRKVFQQYQKVLPSANIPQLYEPNFLPHGCFLVKMFTQLYDMWKKYDADLSDNRDTQYNSEKMLSVFSFLYNFKAVPCHIRLNLIPNLAYIEKYKFHTCIREILFFNKKHNIISDIVGIFLMILKFNHYDPKMKYIQKNEYLINYLMKNYPHDMNLLTSQDINLRLFALSGNPVHFAIFQILRKNKLIYSCYNPFINSIRKKTYSRFGLYNEADKDKLDIDYRTLTRLYIYHGPRVLNSIFMHRPDLEEFFRRTDIPYIADILINELFKSDCNRWGMVRLILFYNKGLIKNVEFLLKYIVKYWQECGELGSMFSMDIYCIFEILLSYIDSDFQKIFDLSIKYRNSMLLEYLVINKCKFVLTRDHIMQLMNVYEKNNTFRYLGLIPVKIVEISMNLLNSDVFNKKPLKPGVRL